MLSFCPKLIMNKCTEICTEIVVKASKHEMRKKIELFKFLLTLANPVNSLLCSKRLLMSLSKVLLKTWEDLIPNVQKTFTLVFWSETTLVNWTIFPHTPFFA